MVCSFFAAQAYGEEPIQPVEPSLGREATFYEDVFPILVTKCLACHSAAVKESDLVLETAESTLKGGASGAAIVPGKPDESLLYRVAARIEEPVMPPLPNKAQAKPLTPQEAGLLRKWILDGAKPGMRPDSANSIEWQPLPESFRATYSLAMSPERRFVAAGRGNRIFMYDIVQGHEVARLSDPHLAALAKDGQPVYGPGVAHRDFVHNLAFNQDGSKLASSGYREVKLWRQLPPLVAARTQQPAAIRLMAKATASPQVVAVLEDNSLRLWNSQTGESGVTIAGGESPVAAAALNAEATLLVAGSSDGKVLAWNPSTGEAVATLSTAGEVTAISIRPAGNEVVVANADNVIRRYAWPPTAEAKPLAELPGHGGRITSLIQPPAANELLSISADATVRLWNLDNAQQLFQQNLGAAVTGAAISADGQLIGACGENGLARVWSRDGQQKSEVKGSIRLERVWSKLNEDHVVAKSRVTIAEQDRAAAEKDLKDREESAKKAQEQLTNAEKELTEAQPKVDAAQAVATEAAKALEAKADDEALKKAKEEADKKLQEATADRDKKQEAVKSAMRGSEISQQSVALGKTALEQRTQAKQTEEAAATALETQATTARAEANQALPPLRGMLLSSDGAVLTTAGNDGLIQQWAATTGASLGWFLQHEGGVRSLLPTQAGFVSAGADQSITAVDLTPRWELERTIGAAAENPLDVSSSPFVDRVLALAFNPEGTLLATGGGEPSRGGELKLFNTTTGEQVREFPEAHSDTVYDLEFSRDGKRIVSGAADKFVKLFDVETGKLVRAYEGHTNHVLGVAMAADGSSLASAGADNAIKLWNTETGEQRRTITSHSKQVTAIDFVGISENVLTCSGDFTVRLHKASNGQNFRNFGGATDYLYRAVSGPEDTVVVAAGEDGEVRVWNGKDGNLIKSFSPPSPPETVGK